MPSQPPSLVVPPSQQAANPGARNLTSADLKTSDLIRVDTGGQVMAQATVGVLGEFLFSSVSSVIPIPLSLFFSAERTTPQAAMQYAHDQGFTAIAFDDAYTFTGGVTISAQHFQIWGYGKVTTKEFNGDLFTLTSATQYTAMRDLYILSQGPTYNYNAGGAMIFSGKIIADSGNGNGHYENVVIRRADLAAYEETAPGAFNRTEWFGGNVGCVDDTRGAIRLWADVASSPTGNGKIFGTGSSTGVVLDCGWANELKVFGITSNFPEVGASVKTHFSNCRLTTPSASITIDPNGTSSLLTLDNCSFGVPVIVRAPNVRLVGCRFNDLTLDCTVSQIAPIQMRGALVYGPNYQGAAIRPGGVDRLPNAASTTFNAIDGDVFTLSANQNVTITAPTNPSPGQVVNVLFTAVSANRTVTLSTGAGAFDSAGFSLTATTDGKTDVLTFLYSRAADRWYMTGYVKGDAAPEPGPRFFNAGAPISQTGNGVDINVPLPSDLVTGAVLLGFVSSKNNQTHTWPAGWTKVDQTSPASNFTQSWAWRIVDSTEGPTVNVLSGGVQTIAGFTMQYTEVNTSPIDSTSVGSSATAVTTRNIPSVTTVSNNARVVYVIMANTGGSGTDAAPGGSWVERGDFGNSPSTHITYGDQYVAVSGSASGAIALTGSVSAIYVARQIELNPV